MTVYIIVRDIAKGCGVNIVSNDYDDMRNNVGVHYCSTNFEGAFRAASEARGWAVDQDLQEYAPQVSGYPDKLRRDDDPIQFYCALFNDLLAKESATAEWAWGDTYQDAFEELTFNDDERLG